MPINTRDLALETLLLMVASALLFMGVAGLVFGIGAQYTLFSVSLVPDAAIITLLLGVGLLAALQHWRKVRLLCAYLLMAVLVYTLVHNQWAGGQQGSWLTGQQRITSIAALVLLAVALCLLIGFDTLRRRWLWLATGTFLWLFVGLVIVRLWRGVEVDSPLFSSSPVAVVVFAVLLGAALVAIGGRRQPERLNPGRWAVVAALTGVALSSVVWLLLSMQQHSATHQQAMYLLDNVQLNAEQAMRTRLDQMQRMAERLDAAGGDVDAALLAQDAQSYLRDMPSLKAIMLLNEEKQRIWSTSRTTNQQMWLEQQITKPRVTNWLSVPLG